MQKNIQIVLSVVAATILLFSAGCAQSDPPESVAVRPKPQGKPAKSKSTTQKGRSPDAESARQLFAEPLVQAIFEGDVDGFNQLIDWDSILNKVTSGIEASPKFRQGFERGIRETLSQKNGLAATLVRSVGNGGAYVLLRTYEKDGVRRAIFRMQTEQGINYHDYALELQGDRVLATDLYVYLSAEEFSSTMRRLYLMAISQQPTGFLDRLTGKEAAFAKNAQKFKAMARFNRNGQFAQAVKIFNELPDSMRTEKPVLIIYLTATAQLGEKQYLEAFDLYRSHYPNDASLDLLSLDAYLSRKQYDKVLESIDRLEEAVQGDPFLDVMRAGVYHESGENDEAMKMVHRAIERQPDLQDAYWTAVEVTMDQKEFGETVKWLKRIENDLAIEIEWATLGQLDYYAEFVKSPEYQQQVAEIQEPSDDDAAKADEIDQR